LSEDKEGSLVSSAISINITDLFGLGKAAETMKPATNKIIEGLSNALGIFTSPARIYLEERAFNAANRHETAKEVELIKKIDHQLKEQPEIAAAMKARLLSTEFRRQVNVNEAARSAIEISNNLPDSGALHSIDPDFVHEWVEAVKDVSSDEVRKMWATVLAVAPTTAEGRIRRPSIELLKQFDQSTARMFRDLCTFVATVGPPAQGHRSFAPFGEHIDLQLFFELGVLADRAFGELQLPDIGRIRKQPLKPSRFKMFDKIEAFALGARGFELAKVIFPEGISAEGLSNLNDLRFENLSLLAHDGTMAIALDPLGTEETYPYQILGDGHFIPDTEPALQAVRTDVRLNDNSRIVLERFARDGRLLIVPQTAV